MTEDKEKQRKAGLQKSVTQIFVQFELDVEGGAKAWAVHGHAPEAREGRTARGLGAVGPDSGRMGPGGDVDDRIRYDVAQRKPASGTSPAIDRDPLES